MVFRFSMISQFRCVKGDDLTYQEHSHRTRSVGADHERLFDIGRFRRARNEPPKRRIRHRQSFIRLDAYCEPNEPPAPPRPGAGTGNRSLDV